jgi:hypothetical protein
VSETKQQLTVARISQLMLFKEVIAVYTENYTKPVNINCMVTEQMVHIVSTGL